MKELWIGVVEVLTEPSTGDGNTRAFTNVVTWAESVPSYVNHVSAVFAKYEWTVLGAENVRPVDPNESYSEDVAGVIERAKTNPNACTFATFHYYPSKPA
jgi:hypothetical protein